MFAVLCFIAAAAWLSLPYETTGLQLFESVADLQAFLRNSGAPLGTELEERAELSSIDSSDSRHDCSVPLEDEK